jgi:hypothetical protein
MPFQSEAQRRYLWANEPEIARDWTDTYGSRIQKNGGGISQLVKSGPGRPGYNGWGDKDEGFADKSFGGNERPGRDVQVTTRNIHDVPQTVTRRTKTVSPKDHFEQSWSGQPGILGLGGGYRNLKTPGVTPERGGAYKSRFNPMGIIGGLGGLLMGIPGLGLGINALKNFPKHQNLADWWRSRKGWDVEEEEDVTSDYIKTPEGYQYVGGSMDDTMQEFRQKYPVDPSKVNLEQNLPYDSNIDMQNYLENQSNFYNLQGVDPSSPEFGGGIMEIDDGEETILEKAKRINAQITGEGDQDPDSIMERARIQNAEERALREILEGHYP